MYKNFAGAAQRRQGVKKSMSNPKGMKRFKGKYAGPDKYKGVIPDHLKHKYKGKYFGKDSRKGSNVGLVESVKEERATGPRTPKTLPPGIAKKPGQLPPGLYKKPQVTTPAFGGVKKPMIPGRATTPGFQDKQATTPWFRVGEVSKSVKALNATRARAGM